MKIISDFDLHVYLTNILNSGMITFTRGSVKKKKNNFYTGFRYLMIEDGMAKFNIK